MIHMKTPARFILMASITATLAIAQDAERNNPPPATEAGRGQPAERPRADGERPLGEGERRREGDRTLGEGDRFRRPEDRPPGEAGRPVDRPRAEGERGRPDGDRPRLDGERPRVEGERRRVEGERRFDEVQPRGEGVARPNTRADGDGGAQRNFLARLPQKPQPYLGIITRDAGPELTSQLRQPEGFGLVVDEVLPDSPAKTAGLERNDLIIKFEDQLLANPPQLEALVRRAGKDKESTLTILRAGAEQKVTIKIGEKMLPERRPLPGLNPGRQQPDLRSPDRRSDAQPRRVPNRESTNVERESGDRVRYMRDQARIVRNDADGTFELRSSGDTRTFSVQKPNGDSAWQGPVGTPAEREAVPAEWRKKLELLERDIKTERPPGDRAPGDRPAGDRPPEPAQR